MMGAGGGGTGATGFIAAGGGGGAGRTRIGGSSAGGEAALLLNHSVLLSSTGALSTPIHWVFRSSSTGGGAVLARWDDWGGGDSGWGFDGGVGWGAPIHSVLFGSLAPAMPMVFSSSIGRNTVSAGEIGREGDGGFGELTGVAACGGGGGAVRAIGGAGTGAGFA